MKTKEQIAEHLEKFSYSPMALSKILVFMIGAKLKDESEKILVKTTDLHYHWQDFWNWYNSEEVSCNECPLCDMLNELINIMENEADPEKVQKAHERYEFLVESFGLDE